MRGADVCPIRESLNSLQRFQDLQLTQNDKVAFAGVKAFGGSGKILAHSLEAFT